MDCDWIGSAETDPFPTLSAPIPCILNDESDADLAATVVRAFIVRHRVFFTA